MGTHPNDFFALYALPHRRVLAASSLGEWTPPLLMLRHHLERGRPADETVGRRVKGWGFLRPELADTVVASFSVTS